MDKKVDYYVNSIISAMWWADKLFWAPTDIIWFNEFWIRLALALEKFVTNKEICFFDENIKKSEVFHYLDFSDMFDNCLTTVAPKYPQ